MLVARSPTRKQNGRKLSPRAHTRSALSCSLTGTPSGVMVSAPLKKRLERRPRGAAEGGRGQDGGPANLGRAAAAVAAVAASIDVVGLHRHRGPRSHLFFVSSLTREDRKETRDEPEPVGGELRAGERGENRGRCFRVDDFAFDLFF